MGWGVADFLAKQTIDRIGAVASLIWAHLFGTLALCIGAFLYLAVAGDPTGLPHEASPWLALLMFGAGLATVYLLVYRAFAKGPVSLLSPIFASYSGIVAALSIVVFGEGVTRGAVGCLALMFAGVLLVSMEGSFSSQASIKSVPPGVVEALASATVAAVWAITWDKFIGGKSWLSYTAVMYGAMTLVIVVIASARRTELTRPRGRAAILLAGIGVAEIAAYIAIGIGFSETPHTSWVALLSGSFAVPTVLLARLFLGEELSRVQIAGIAAIVLAGVALPIT